MKHVLFVLVLFGAAGLGSGTAWGFDMPKPKKEKDKPAKTDDGATAKPADNGSGGAAAPAKPDAAPSTDALIATIDGLVDKALAAYNADDSKAFFADYCKSMAGIANDQTFNALYRNRKPQLGNYVSRSMIKARSSFTADGPGLAVYTGVFEKDKAATISVNYVKEDGAYKLMQVQINPSTAAAAATPGAAPGGTPGAVQTIETKVPKSAWDKGGLGSSKVGDFVEYEFPANAGMKSRQEVVEAGDHTMTLEVTSTFNGNQTKSRMKMIYSEPDSKVEGKTMEVKEFPDSATVSKGTFAGTRYESYLDGKLTGKAWMSKDVPVTGMVKAESPDGKPTMVLSDYGRGK